jgi:hypothetical protein
MITKYAYDAAGRMVKEGAKSYRYGYLDKVMSMTEGKNRITYGYHAVGQMLVTPSVVGDSKYIEIFLCSAMIHGRSVQRSLI